MITNKKSFTFNAPCNNTQKDGVFEDASLFSVHSSEMRWGKTRWRDKVAGHSTFEDSRKPIILSSLEMQQVIISKSDAFV